jgi:hypothetical protein
MYKWATAAKEIVNFDKNLKRGNSRYLIIKYEDILNNIEGEIKKMLSFLNLDIEKYDVARANNLPVRGSSTFKGEKDIINWKPVNKTADFTPLKRWGNWSRHLHEMFNALGGEYSNYFGYEDVRFESHKLYWWVWVKIWSFNRIRRFYSHIITLRFKETVKRFLGEERVNVLRKYINRYNKK